MKKLLTIVLVFLFTLGVNAKAVKRDISSIIAESGIPKDSISVSIKDVSSGKTVYQLNDKILMHPASVQKILTLPAYIDVLGDEYEFKTGVYRRNNAEYLFKLGADPFLDSSDLKSLAGEIDKQAVQKIYIDDSIVEMKDWGEGWQWDDDLNTYMPRFNSYNLDGNILSITIMPEYDKKIDSIGGKTMIINPSKYPLVFFNNVTVGDKTNVSVTRDNSISSNMLTLSGTVSGPCTIEIPIKNLKRYFNIRLTKTLEDKRIYLKENYVLGKKQSSDKMLAEVKHPISDAQTEILKNSNNMMIETIGKLAGGKAYKKTGTDKDGINVFNDFCKKNDIDNSGIRIVDSSGVSKNNLVYTDFVTEFLVKLKDNKTLSRMACPSEGTLSERMIPLKDNLTAKTGTLSDISSIAGYLTSRNGSRYAFCIIINDPKSTKSQKATLEDYIIREIYLKG